MPDLIERQSYLRELFRFRDTDLVKVVTGIRRCGKSSLLRMAAERLQGEDIELTKGTVPNCQLFAQGSEVETSFEKS
ncbi:MAG: hypothetical protein LBO07_06955 [Coriobacteriales bacterium]|nr:hypothetical protein [Coriobacteriales bacterium]